MTIEWYVLQNKVTKEYSTGMVSKGWRGDQYTVGTSLVKYKTFKDLDTIKRHLLNMMMKNISTDDWEVRIVRSDRYLDLKDLVDEKMLMKLLKVK